MLKKITIGSKITVLVLAVVLLSVLSVSYIAFNLSKQSVEDSALKSINVMADLKTRELGHFFQQIQDNLHLTRQ
jgi:hypothetical protein